MPDTTTTPRDATGGPDPQDASTGRSQTRRIVSYLWLPTPLEKRGYDWMEDHHIFVNVLLGIAFPPYGIFLLILWAVKGYDADR